jgi:hypothetical protein
MKNDDMKDCRDICHKGKHLTLTKHPDPEAITKQAGYGDSYGFAYGGGEIWVLHTGNRIVDVRGLVAKVINRWEDFLPKITCNCF